MVKPENMDLEFIVKKHTPENAADISVSPENAYLVRKLKQKDNEAFRTIYEIYYSRILAYCTGYVIDRNIAQELTQDTFVKLWEKSELFPDDTMLKPLLYRIARNNSLNYLKHVKVTEKYSKMQAHQQSEIEMNLYALSDESAHLIISE